MDISPRLTFPPAPPQFSVSERADHLALFEEALAHGLLQSGEVSRLQAIIARWTEANPLAQQLAWYTAQLCRDILQRPVPSAS